METVGDEIVELLHAIDNMEGGCFDTSTPCNLINIDEIAWADRNERLAIDVGEREDLGIVRLRPWITANSSVTFEKEGDEASGDYWQ
jgi:hypothetical protein